MADDVLTGPWIQENGSTFTYLPPPVKHRPDIADIQRRADNSFILVLNGLPFHATEAQTPEVHQYVLEAIQSGQVVTDYIEPIPPFDDQASAERIWRDISLDAFKWLRERHRDEMDLGVASTLTAEQFKELLTFLQALRDWPQSPDFPTKTLRPIQPDWIAEQTR